MERRVSAPLNVGHLLARFLTGRPGIDFCDDCLADVLRISRSEMEEAIRRLAVRNGFLRDRWNCRRCGRRAMVTRAVFCYALLRRKAARGAVA